MKKYQFIAAAALAMAAISCTKETPITKETEMKTALTVRLDMPESTQTKAVAAYTTSQPYESKVNTAQVFVFDLDGALNGYVNSTSTSVNLSVTSGQKTVYAVANGPDLSSVKSLDELRQKAVGLEDNSIDASLGFVMTGENDCEVSGSSATCAVTVKRLVSRVALVSVKNSLPSSYGDIQIERVWISNVVGNQNLDGSAEPSVWYNKEGRADEASRNAQHIINGSTYKASNESLTYTEVGESLANNAVYEPSIPHLFYGYPNSSTTAPDGFNDPFEAQRTVLVVAATVGNKLYYYPVVLDDAVLVRNTAYTVGLTITGLGSDDPNKPVSKGGLDVNISVAEWESGATYDEVI